MCTPFLPEPQQRSLFFAARILGYSTVGAVLGLFGQSLKASLEYQIGAAIAFLIFGALMLIIAGFSVFPTHKVHLPQWVKGSGPSRGLLFAAIPCGNLAFFYALAIMTGSALGGGLVLFSHAVLSTPALAYSQRFLQKNLQRWQFTKRATGAVIFSLCLLNLFYLGSRIFLTEAEATTKLHFCL